MRASVRNNNAIAYQSLKPTSSGLIITAILDFCSFLEALEHIMSPSTFMLFGLYRVALVFAGRLARVVFFLLFGSWFGLRAREIECE